MNVSSIRKVLINVLTIVVTAGPWILKAMDVFPGTNGTMIATLLSSVLGFAAVVLHYLVPNTTTNPKVAAEQSVKLVTAPHVAA
jgi:hypothetical protein